jgi:hypothetical protein
MAEDETWMTGICATSSVVEMHVAELKTDTRGTSALNRISMKKGLSLLRSQWGRNAGGVKAFLHDLKRVCWPLNIKLPRIEKYDGSTNPAGWLKVYQLSIEAASGDS